MTAFPSGNCAKTICGWFKSSDQTNRPKVLFGFGKAYDKYNFQVGIYNNLFRVNGWGGSNDWLSTTNATSYLNGSWHHCVVTYDGTTTSIYIDGAKKSSTTAYRYYTDPANSEIVIGNEIDYGGWEWAGNIDDVRIYKRALTATDVSSLYNLEKNTCLLTDPQ